MSVYGRAGPESAAEGSRRGLRGGQEAGDYRSWRGADWTHSLFFLLLLFGGILG